MTSPGSHRARPHSRGTVSLWSHLLQNDLTSQGPSPAETFLPPPGPVDKNGTSMRILLHDTQANFEKFTQNVNKLLASSEGARKELMVVKSQFEREHDDLSNEIANLGKCYASLSKLTNSQCRTVNRSQTEVTKRIGQLEQSTALLISSNRELTTQCKSTDSRIDALQMVRVFLPASIHAPDTPQLHQNHVQNLASQFCNLDTRLDSLQQVFSVSSFV